MNVAPGRRPTTAGRATRGSHGVPDELLDRAVSGDPEAVEALIGFIRPLVARYCRARLGRLDRDILVEDVVQEVCMAVLAALPTVRAQGRPFLAFVHGVASRHVVDVYRRHTDHPVAEAPDQGDTADGPEQHVLRAELTSELARHLDALPAHHREILVLRIAAGLSAEETAEVVGTTPGAVRVAQHRALARLRTTIIEDGVAPPDVVELLADLDGEPLRRSHTAYVEALAPVLDLDAGLAHLEDRGGHRGFVAGLAGRLNLDAGLDALLRRAGPRDP